MSSYWVRTLRGLESIAADEARARLGARDVECGRRDLLFTSDTSPVALGCADDAFALLAVAPPLIRGRRGALEAVAGLAAHVPGPARRVTVSLARRCDASRFELADALLAAVGTDPVGAELRVHATAERTLLGRRLAERPLHRRAWRVAEREGGLHPPLARALARLAAAPAGGALLDPLCGTGTLAIEAALEQPAARVFGCDADPAAIAAAHANARAAGCPAWLCCADAASLALADAGVDAVAVNPPWERQVQARGRLAAGFGPLARELARVLRPGAAAVTVEPALGPLTAALRATGLSDDGVWWVRVAGAETLVTRLRR